MIKYFVPFALNFLIFFSLKADLDEPYGDYHIFWQVVGFLFPLSGIFTFVLSFIFCTEKEPFDHDVDAEYDENDRVGTGKSSYEAGLVKADDQKPAPIDSVVMFDGKSDGN